MSAEQSKALGRRYFEEVLAGNLAAADEILADDLAFYGPNYWGKPMYGREAFKQFVHYLRSAFPDIHFTVVDEIADESKVATSFVLRATHQGEWMGLPSTGKRVELPGVDTFRVAGGKIAEIRVFYDTLGLMQQLGFAPAPAEAAAT